MFSSEKARREIEACAKRAIEILNYFSSELGRDYSKRVTDLSQGDRRRVEICRALVSNPKLLLLDEPSAGMSPEETERLMEDILKLKEIYRDISIIIEHDMMVIESIAQHVVVFNYGKKIAKGTFSEIAHNEEGLKAYLGEESEDAQA